MFWRFNFMKRFLSVLIVGLIVVSAVFANAASDAAFPSQPITITVPVSAGGGTDLLVRAMAPALQENLGVSVTVQNVTGAGGAIGFAQGASQRPDGYNVTSLVAELLTVPQVSPVNFSYQSFVPVCNVNSEYGTITVRADAPYDTLPEFIEYCKAHPGEVSFGNSGIGGIWHFVAAAFAQAAGIEVTHVPFEGGGTAVVALAGGHVDAVPVTPQEVEVQVKAGTAKILAVLAPERLSYLPDVPTAAEYGYDNLVFTIWRGFGVPLNTPQEVVDRLAEAFQAALDDEAVTQFMNERGYSKAYMSGPELYDLMAREEAIYAEQAVALGLKQN